MDLDDPPKHAHTLMFTRELWRRVSIRAAAEEKDRSQLIAEWIEERLRRYRKDPTREESEEPDDSPAPTAPDHGVMPPGQAGS